MRAFVVYESMYGNTAKIAEAIGRGLVDAGMDATVVPFNRLAVEQVVDAICSSSVVRRMPTG